MCHKEEMTLADKRVFEVMYIAHPETTDEIIAEMNQAVDQIVKGEDGEITITEDMGVREMAYAIQKHRTGRYVLFEIESSGREIAELERRFRVNDFIIRYLTVRVDEERKTAAKLTAKRDKQKKRVSDLMSRSGSEEQAENGGEE